MSETRTAAEAVDALMSERDFARVVIDAAKLLGWRVYWSWSSVHSPAGFPDLVLVRPPRVVFAELKSERGRLSVWQRETIDLLGQCPGVETYVWRPSDWRELERILRGGPGPVAD